MIRKHSLFEIAFVLFSRDSSTTSCTLQIFIYSVFKTAEVRGQIANSNRLDLLAQLAEHWTRKPKVTGSIPAVVRQNFRLPGVDILREASPIYTFTLVHKTTKHHMLKVETSRVYSEILKLTSFLQLNIRGGKKLPLLPLSRRLCWWQLPFAATNSYD